MSVARDAGVHGVYLGNHLSREATVGDGGEVYGFYLADSLGGLAYFGTRGNLVLLEKAPLDPSAVVDAIARSGNDWRIALGPRDTMRTLAGREPRPPLVLRRQIYYGCEPGEVCAELANAEVREAERRDVGALIDAALDLNQSDLHVDPQRVHRAWLKEAVRRRIRLGQTVVIGAAGRPVCKLDLGSCGPLGMVVEGVHTHREARGRGLATRLVATVIRSGIDLYPIVCLHVGAENAPARRAYERAGMRELGECELVLRG